MRSEKPCNNSLCDVFSTCNEGKGVGDYRRTCHRYQRYLGQQEGYAAGIEWAKNQKPMVCPFCGEGDFDQIGLSHHLETFCCNEYAEVYKAYLDWRTR